MEQYIHVLALKSSVDCCNVEVYIYIYIYKTNSIEHWKCLYFIKYSGLLWVHVHTVNTYLKNLYVCIYQYILFCNVLMNFSVINSEILHCVWLCESTNIVVVVINSSDLKLDHLLIKTKLILFTIQVCFGKVFVNS